MDRIKQAWRTVLAGVLLGAITAGVYWPVTRYGFVNFDDPNYLTENAHVQRGLTWDNISWALRSGAASNWHPLTWLSHMLDVQLFGMKAGGHHLTNVLFHTANALLLLLLLKRMTGSVWRSAFVAALFAWHPLHVESVAWVAERKDVLSTFFFLLTLLAYHQYASQCESVAPKSAKGGSRITHHASRATALWYCAALFLFALGLMSKPMLVTLPFVLLLLDLWPLNRLQLSTLNFKPLTSNSSRLLRLVLEKVPFLALAFTSSAITFVVQKKGGAVSSLEGFPLLDRIANAFVSYLKYLGKAVWPTDLAVFYPHPGLTYEQWPAWQVVAAALVLTGVSVLALLRLKRQPWFATGWFWYLGTLVPVIGIVQVGGQALADRYTYIPLIGAFICLVWGISEALSRMGTQSFEPAVSQVSQPAQAGSGPSPANLQSLPTAKAAIRQVWKPALLGVAAVVACVLLTHKQIGFWKNDFTLFEQALAVTEKNAPAHFNLGTAYGRQGKYGMALAHSRAALQADPSYADAEYSLGYIYTCLGRPEDALRHYEACLRIKPDYVMARNNLGAMLWSLGKSDEAFKQYAEAARLDPEFPDARYNLGITLANANKPAEAVSHFAEAVRLKPDYPEALTAWGSALAKLGRLEEARSRFEEVVRLSPADAESRLNLAVVLRRLGKHEAALEQYGQALRLNPQRPESHFQLATFLLEQGKVERAESEYSAALKQKPDYAEALDALGGVLAMQGKLAEAQAKFREALRLCPTNAETQVKLGNALHIAGQTNEAAACFAQALRLEPDLPDKNLQAGKALVAEGKLEPALGRFTTAAWLQPNNAQAHEQAGLLLAQLGRLAPAGEHFEQVLRLRPEDPQAAYNLALARVMQGKAREAVALYQQSLKLRPDNVEALNNLAWLLATHPQADVRNGAEALRLAQRACELSGGKQARFWGTLDAACAEVGRFDDAVATAQKTRELALAAGEKELAQAAAQRLALYKERKPFRQ